MDMPHIHSQVVKYDGCVHKVSNSDLKLVETLLALSDEDGCSISKRRMASLTGFSLTYLTRLLQRMTENGMLEIHPVFHDDGGQTANRYCVTEYGKGLFEHADKALLK